MSILAVKVRWQSLRERTKKRIITFVLALPTMLYATYQLVNAANEWWQRETISFTVTTGPNAGFIKGISDDNWRAIFTKGYQSSMIIPNHTSTKLSNVVVLLPYEGCLAAIDDSNTVFAFWRNEKRVTIREIPPLSSVAVVLWHDQEWKPGDEALVGSEEYGKVSIDPSPYDYTNDVFKVGFWLQFIILSLILIKWFVDWLRGPTVRVNDVGANPA